MLETPDLRIPRDFPFVSEIVECWGKTASRERIWKFSLRTAYSILDRAFECYPHYFRLSRITNFILER